MDEMKVREQAETHAKATVAGDFRTAGSTLTEEARAQAPGVMKAMPATLTGSEIGSIETVEDETIVRIRYIGDEGETLVESRWAEREGRPMIVDLRVP